jgi:integrase
MSGIGSPSIIGGTMFLFKRQNGIYYLVQEVGGKKKWISTRSRYKQDALEFVRSFNERQKQVEEPKVAPISLREFIDQFLQYSEMVHTVKTNNAFRVTFGMLERYFGEVNLTEITTNELERFFTKRIKEASIYAARKDRINLSSAFNKAVRDKLLRENPCHGIGKFRIPEKLPLFFSAEEFRILLAMIDKPDIRDLVEFACYTGLRQMELLTLRWEQVSLSDGILILDNRMHTTKSKKIRTIPLNRKAQDILIRRKQISETEFVFTLNHKPITQNNITKIFKKYVIKAKLNSKLSFHSLRHTFASWLAQRGVSIYQVSKLLGHSSVNVTAIYAHLQTDNLREQVEKLLEARN